MIKPQISRKIWGKEGKSMILLIKLVTHDVDGEICEETLFRFFV